MAVETNYLAEEIARRIESLTSEQQQQVAYALFYGSSEKARNEVVQMLDTFQDESLNQKYQREPLDEWLKRTKRSESRAAMVRLLEYAALVAVIVTACVWAAIK